MFSEDGRKAGYSPYCLTWKGQVKSKGYGSKGHEQHNEIVSFASGYLIMEKFNLQLFNRGLTFCSAVT